jgi:hypothetical protein
MSSFVDLKDNWSRPIFNLDADMKHLTKEERLARDMEHVKTLTRRSSDDGEQGKRGVDDFLSQRQKHKKKNEEGAENSNK